MAIRQRHVYETAFDSLVRNEIEDFDVLLQSPLLRAPQEKLRLSPRERRHPVQSITSTEKRKVTLVKDSHFTTSPRPRKIHVREKSANHIANTVFAALSSCWDDHKESAVAKKVSPKLNPAFGTHHKLNGLPPSFETHCTKADGETENDESPSKTKFPLVHSKTTVDHCKSEKSIEKYKSPIQNEDAQRPVCFNTNFQGPNDDSKDLPSDNKAFSPSVEFKKLDVDDKCNHDIQEDPKIIRQVKYASQSNGLSTCMPPSNAIQKGFLREPMKDRGNLSKDTSRQVLASNPFFKGSRRPSQTETVQPDSVSLNAELQYGCKAKYVQNFESAPTSQNNSPENKSFGNTDRKKLSLDFSSSPKRARQNLTLEFGWRNPNIFGEMVDATLQLQKQGWYHGSINRQEAENVLRLLKQGSYLVRSCENSRNNYFLSLKSSHGVIHVKIGCSDGKFCLKQLQEEFGSIPEMICFYSRHCLPIHGAEHMVLMHPVIDQLL